MEVEIVWEDIIAVRHHENLRSHSRMRFEVPVSISMHVTVIWGVKPHSFIDSNFLEEPAISIFRVEDWANQGKIVYDAGKAPLVCWEPWLWPSLHHVTYHASPLFSHYNPEDGGNWFLVTLVPVHQSSWCHPEGSNLIFLFPVFLQSKFPQTVMLLSSVWEVLDSNLCWDTSCPVIPSRWILG
jgi:hypothetical protein